MRRSPVYSASNYLLHTTIYPMTSKSCPRLRSSAGFTAAAFGLDTRPQIAAGPNGIDHITANSQILSHLQSMVI